MLYNEIDRRPRKERAAGNRRGWAWRPVPLSLEKVETMSRKQRNSLPSKKIRELKIGDLMTVDPATIGPDTLLRDVIQLMKLEGCRQLPVLDEHDQLVGIISDRDVRLAMNSPIVLHERWQDELLVQSVTAESCMTPNPITVEPDMPATRAAALLSTFKFGALPVVADNRLLGIISVSDFLDWFAGQEPEEIPATAAANE
jgi:acetoin utilization protein AcuB